MRAPTSPRPTWAALGRLRRLRRGPDWWARQEVYDQAAQAAYVVNGGQATLYTAGADGQPVDWAVIRAFSGISQQQHLNQNVVDLVPAAPGDPAATGMFWLSYAWNVVPLR